MGLKDSTGLERPGADWDLIAGIWEPPRNACGHHISVPSCRESAEYWIATIREQMANSTGPLFNTTEELF